MRDCSEKENLVLSNELKGRITTTKDLETDVSSERSSNAGGFYGGNSTFIDSFDKTKFFMFHFATDAAPVSLETRNLITVPKVYLGHCESYDLRKLIH